MRLNIICIVFAVAIVLLAAGCKLSEKNAGQAQEKAPVKLGFVADLTGNLANVGSEERIGTEIARDEVNAAGGINGRPMEIIFEDGRCSPKDAMSAATKLATIDKAKVILGGTCTGESMAISKVATDNKIIEMSAVTSGSVYSNTGEWTFRTNPVDDGKALVDHLLNKGHTKFGLLNEQTDFSQSVRKDFKKWVEEKGGQVVGDENFESDATDIRTQLIKLKAANPDAYFLNSNSGVIGVSVAKQARELGLQPLYGSRAYEAAKASDFPEILEGLVFYSTVGIVNTGTSQAKVLFDEYRKRTGKEPFCTFCIASRYDGLKLIAKAMKQCGEDSACIKDWLYNMPPYEGVIGTFTFDSNGDPVGIKYAFSIFHDGKVAPLEP